MAGHGQLHHHGRRLHRAGVRAALRRDTEAADAHRGRAVFLYSIVAIVVDFVAFDHRLHPLQLVGVVAILLAAAGMNLGWSLRQLRAPVVE